MNKKIGLSIIINFYNEKKYKYSKLLNKLFSSKNYYFDIEFILIFDNPQNKQLFQDVKNILSNYDVNFKLIKNKENLGLSRCRNIGIANSNSKNDFIIFIDADDDIDTDFLEIIRKTLSTANADIYALSNNVKFYKHYGEIIDYKRKNIFDSNIKYIFSTSHNVFNFSSLNWGSQYFIWKKSFLKKHSIEFLNEKILYEDIYFFILSYIFSDNIYICNDSYYTYIVWNDSSSIMGKSSYLDIIRNFKIIIEKIICIFKNNEFLSCQFSVRYERFINSVKFIMNELHKHNFSEYNLSKEKFINEYNEIINILYDNAKKNYKLEMNIINLKNDLVKSFKRRFVLLLISALRKQYQKFTKIKSFFKF